jgi:hypothetical protein
VGEGIAETGDVHLVVGFEFQGHWVGYQLAPAAGVDIVHMVSEWLDRHARAHDADKGDNERTEDE